MGGFLDARAERFGDSLAVVSGETRWTYGELARHVWALQWALTDLGVEPGERVAVLLSSFPEWIVYLFAVTRMGCVFVPLNPRFGTHELAYILRHSGSGTLVSMGRYLDRDYGPTVAEVTGGPPSGNGAPRLPALRRVIGVRGLSTPGSIDGEALLARGRARLGEAGAPPRRGAVEDPAILFYTSGTTAFPKGVQLTPAHLLPHSIRCGALLELGPGDRVLSLYPFFGISGANKVLSTLGWGACLIFQDAFRPGEAYELLEGERCSVVHAVDVQIRELVRIAKTRGPGSPPARRGTIAFMAGLDEGLAREMGEVLGLRRFVHPYGMTETNPMVLRNELDDPFEARLRPGGRVAPGVEVRVVEPASGRGAEVGEPGEIVVRGETVMGGYYQDPEATAAAFDDAGWFHTGDLGVRTAEGFIFYLGRLKDMLKVGGFNVSPQEVEAYLRTHEAIADVAVTGAPDPRLAEVVVAFVRRRGGSTVSEAELQQYCRGHIANFKIPRRIHFVDELPYHTAAHGAKLRRATLREWARARGAGDPG